MNKIISLIIVLLSILACNETSFDHNSIIGKWQGKTEKTTMTLIFYPDSTVRIVFADNNGIDEFLLKYKIDKKSIISFSEKFEPGVIKFVDKDTIEIRPLKKETRVFIDLIYVTKFKREES